MTKVSQLDRDLREIDIENSVSSSANPLYLTDKVDTFSTYDDHSQYFEIEPRHLRSAPLHAACLCIQNAVARAEW